VVGGDVNRHPLFYISFIITFWEEEEFTRGKKKNTIFFVEGEVLLRDESVRGPRESSLVLLHDLLLKGRRASGDFATTKAFDPIRPDCRDQPADLVEGRLPVVQVGEGEVRAKGNQNRHEGGSPKNLTRRKKGGRIETRRRPLIRRQT